MRVEIREYATTTEVYAEGTLVAAGRDLTAREALEALAELPGLEVNVTGLRPAPGQPSLFGAAADHHGAAALRLVR